MIRSTCCDAPIFGADINETICSKCKKECDTYNDDIHETEKLNGKTKQKFDPRECGI